MKLIKNSNFTLLIILITILQVLSIKLTEKVMLNSLDCSQLEKFESGSEKTDLEANRNGGFQIWAREAQAKMSGQSVGPDCTNVAQCRVYDEVVFIAYCKLKKLKEILKHDVFLMKFDRILSQGGVSKFQLVMNGDHVANGMSASGIFKLCVPTNRLKHAYLIYECPLSDCLENYGNSFFYFSEEGLDCGNKKHVPNSSINYHLITP